MGYATVTSHDNEHLLPASTVLDTPLDLADPADERYGAKPGGAADVAGCGIEGGALAPGLFRWRAMNYWMGGFAPENASGSTFPQPGAEAEVQVSREPGLATFLALGGPSTVGGVAVTFVSPQPGAFEVAHYAPAATDDLLALLGAASSRHRTRAPR